VTGEGLDDDNDSLGDDREGVSVVMMMVVVAVFLLADIRRGRRL
jgi:hypothetical protein